MELAEDLTARILGANLCFNGIPELSQLPKGSKLTFPSGATLIVEEYNPPCHDMSEEIYLAQYASIEISKDGEYIETVYPEKRVYDSSSMGMTEAGIEANLFRDLFIAVGEDIGGGSWSMHLQYKPLLRLIWYGPIVMMLGGFVRVFLSKKNLENYQ